MMMRGEIDALLSRLAFATGKAAIEAYKNNPVGIGDYSDARRLESEIIAAYDAQGERIAALEAALARLDKMLQRLEWAEYDGTIYCPICDGFQWPHGHRADCELAAALDAAREVMTDDHD